MPTATQGVVIHPSAVVSDEAELGPGVSIGPGCVLLGRVVLRENVRLIAGVHLNGPITIGAGTIVWPGACLGFSAQDYKVKPDDPTPGVEIGAGCLIREHVTVHAPTRQDRPTRIGDHVFMMVGAHAAHDVQVGNHCVLVNNIALAGHVELGERVTMGGHSVLHQFCRAGRLSMLGGNATLTCDVPPFCLAVERNTLHGLNVVGLRRNGVSRDDITLLRTAFRDVLCATRAKAQIVDGLRALGPDNPLLNELVAFYSTSKRTIAIPAHFRGRDEPLEGLSDD